MLNSEQEKRDAQDSMSLLSSLIQKHQITKTEFKWDAYSRTCGDKMAACNKAFTDLCWRMDRILAASFEESPRGDKNRVKMVADNLILLLTNAFYSVTWANAKSHEQNYPKTIDPNNLAQVKKVSDENHLKWHFENWAVAAYERWVVTKKFSSCRMCDSCGGDYPVYAGEGFRGHHNNYWTRYREQCSGDLYKGIDYPKLCCSVDQPRC